MKLLTSVLSTKFTTLGLFFIPRFYSKTLDTMEAVFNAEEPLVKKPKLDEEENDGNCVLAEPSADSTSEVDKVEMQSEKSVGITEPSADSTSEVDKVEMQSEKSVGITEPSADSTSEGDKAEIQSEKSVGITEYVSDHPPIFGIIKQRFSDFLVNEIALDGSVVKLTDLNPPAVQCQIDWGTTTLNTDVINNLRILSEDTKSTEKIIIPCDDLDKYERKAIHVAIRANFPKLISNTADKDGAKTIEVGHKKTIIQNRREWQPDRANYTYFVLYKENRDTMDAINTIANTLRMKSGMFTYAGTKDRRAKTSQWVSVKRLEPERLLALNKCMNYMTVGNIEFKEKPLKLGDLKGNRFTIIVREVRADEELIDKSLESLRDKGFINYYGMQRFGSTSVPTHHIGCALIKSDLAAAINLIMKPRSADDAKLDLVRKIWFQTGDAGVALSKLPRHRYNCIEGQLLQGLQNHHPHDYVNILNSVARNTRLMYVHSYQSYVWNRAVSYRIREHGFKIIIGDLVKSVQSDLNYSENPSEEVKEQWKRQNIHVVTDDDVANNKYDIYDVILPLPGFDIIYPDNEIKNIYKEITEEDGVDFDNMEARVKTYYLSGSYRKILIHPNDINWSIHKYGDNCVPIALSDKDIIDGIQLECDNNDGDHKAIKLNLSLPSSSYATMALREVLKIDTSSNYQKTLNSSSTS